MAKQTVTARKKARAKAAQVKRDAERSAVEVPTGPGYDGTRELETVVLPGRTSRSARVVVKRNVRAATVQTMIARRQLTGPQGQAAERFARIHDALALAANQAVDLSRPIVDTSGRADPIPDVVLEAGFEMAAVARLVGLNEYTVIKMIAGLGYGLRDVAVELSGKDDAKTLKSTGFVLRKGLTSLAVYWGYHGSPQARAQINQWMKLTSPKAVIDSREWIRDVIALEGDADKQA